MLLHIKPEERSDSRLSKHKTAALPNVWHATKVLLEVVQGKHGNMDLQRCLLRQEYMLMSYILKLEETKATVYLNSSATFSLHCLLTVQIQKSF